MERRDSKAYAYMVRCVDQSLYTGWAFNMEQRLEAHNGQRPGGAKYTRARRPVTLAWLVQCADKITAQRIEHIIKGLPKVKKEALIRGDVTLWFHLIDGRIDPKDCSIVSREDGYETSNSDRQEHPTGCSRRRYDG